MTELLKHVWSLEAWLWVPAFVGQVREPALLYLWVREPTLLYLWVREPTLLYVWVRVELGAGRA